MRAVYRPPNRSLDVFNLGLNAVLNVLDKSKMEYLLAGDFNIDLLKHNTHEGAEDIINTELSKISQWFKLNKLSLNIKQKKLYNFPSR